MARTDPDRRQGAAGALGAAERQRLIRIQDVPIVAVGAAIVPVPWAVSAVVIHGVVMDTCPMSKGMLGKAEMITTARTHVAAHCHAADMNASAEAAHVGTAATSASAAAPC